jgi:hypothetical protein
LNQILMAVYAVVTLAVQVQTQPDSTTRISPLFSDGPTFMLECTNTSSVPLEIMDAIAQEAIRLDGKVYEHEGGVGGSLGVPTAIEPQSLWKTVFPLIQTSGRTGPTTLGARVRGGWSPPFSAGRHTLAIRCAGTWSNEIEFYWDDQPPR